MLLLVVLAVAASGVVAVPGVSFSHAFIQPSPFNYKHQPQSNIYAYGYGFPGQTYYHEIKNDQNAVKGHVGYVDAYGVPLVWPYFSGPHTGLKGQIDTVPVVPVVPQDKTPAAGVSVEDQPQPFRSGLEEKVIASLSPLLKLAVDTGVVKSVGSSPYGAEYVVSPHLAEEVGGVSSLAYRLGAIPVAAVHDVQVRPNFRDSETAFSPVLVHKETPQITLYTLEVPSQ